ncbi:unnamed protein product [Schistocephalus solidus]|uniref:Uncharacterized protein n=1 Tax=Schistocephalus solidus TaxID=70667 RepID=A0A183TCT0_SCHSO|nr:unnamed protein product [Schistocephalus solidus]
MFLERGKEFKFSVGFHLRQLVDGAVGDGGGPVKNASEVLGQTLQKLRHLNLLSLVSHLGIVHLPQSLLYKAATSVEGCLVCIGRVLSVGFVPLVLLNEQSVYGCVVVIKLVLVFTVCVVEDIQGNGLNRVPQLALAVVHEDVLVAGRNVGLPVGQLVAEIEMVRAPSSTRRQAVMSLNRAAGTSQMDTELHYGS